jgi:hypothetical protein
MQKLIFFVLSVLLSSSVFGQSTFHKRFLSGGLQSITPLSNGEFLGYGTQRPYENQNHDGLIVRFNEAGNILWSKRYPIFNYINFLAEVGNGYIILGDTTLENGQLPWSQFSVVSRISGDGNIIWSKKLGLNTGRTRPIQVIGVPGGSVVSGSFTPFIQSTYQTSSVISRLDENGSTLWSKMIFSNTPSSYRAFSVRLIQGDTLYAYGNSQGNGCFLRLNSNTGELLGASSFGGIYLEEIADLKATQDGNFLLAGFTRSTTGSEESRPWVVKVNRTGQIIWSKTYNLLGTSLICDMAEANDGGFVLAMDGDNAFTNNYGIIAKIDETGNLIWAYNYAGGQDLALREIKSTLDGGFVALGNYGILKVDGFGRVNNGCCPAPINFQVEDYIPPYQDPALVVTNWESTASVSMTCKNEYLKVTDYCEVSLTTVVEQLQVCQGDSIQINGSFFQAPYIYRDTVRSSNGGCDTVRVYNLMQIPQPFRVATISFCPGSSVVVNGMTYSQPDTIFQILPSTSGCDTLLVTFLSLKPIPKKYQTTTFCPGDTVFLNGIGYQAPGILPNPDTLAGPVNGCDTLLYQVLDYPSIPSEVRVNCPPNIALSTDPGTFIVSNYALPTATSDCTCPDLFFSLVQGPPPGTSFPIGTTQVCYSVSDICGDYETCCFDVKVLEKPACDIKKVGCIQYELLGISIDPEQHKTYRMRLTNDCNSNLSYVAFQIPNGIDAISPTQFNTYFSPNGMEYSVRNPNHSPFRSIRFKPLSNGISSGASDIFEYTLSAQSSPTFIKATTKLASGTFYETTLNTFGCTEQADKLNDRTEKSTITQSLHIFPNPNSGELFVDFSGWVSGPAQLRILNLQGQELAQKVLRTDAGVQSLTIPSTLVNGFYFLEAKSESGEKQVLKFTLWR